jgi:hypothetical protein
MGKIRKSGRPAIFVNDPNDRPMLLMFGKRTKSFIVLVR